MADKIAHIPPAATTSAGAGPASTSTQGNTEWFLRGGGPERTTDANQLPEGSQGPRTAWVVLDEASQSLLRAESIVALLAIDNEMSAHHSYAGEVASDLLRAVGLRLSEAQQLVHQSHTEDWRLARAQTARLPSSDLVQSLRKRILQLEATLAEPSAVDRSLADAAEGCMLLAKQALDHACGCLQES